MANDSFETRVIWLKADIKASISLFQEIFSLHLCKEISGKCCLDYKSFVARNIEASESSVTEQISIKLECYCSSLI